MLNAELKSMNSILTYESFLSRCVRAGWRAVATASSVERYSLPQAPSVSAVAETMGYPPGVLSLGLSDAAG